MNDPRTSSQIAQDHSLANEFAEKGTLKHFMLRKGFMPHDEKDAEAILNSIILENENFQWEIDQLKAELTAKNDIIAAFKTERKMSI